MTRPSQIIGQFTGRRLRVLAAAGVLTVAGATATVATVANAQQPTPAPTTSPRPSPSAIPERAQALIDYINRLAQNLGVPADRLRAALQQTALQEVDAALARGEITAQQAQQARERINAGELHLGPGAGRGGPGGRGGGFFASHEQIAQFLGITAEQLRTELNGQSLAQVAQAHGRTRAQLVQFLVSAAQQQIAAAVQAGRLTQAEATQRQAELQARIEQKVDEVRQPGQRTRPSPSATP